LLAFNLESFCATRSSTIGTPPVPEANPGRPTVSTPATLTPVGYLQFENGVLFAQDSTEFSKRLGIGQVTRLSVLPRLELLLPRRPPWCTAAFIGGFHGLATALRHRSPIGDDDNACSIATRHSLSRAVTALRLSGRFVCLQTRFQPSHEDHTPREFGGGNDPVVTIGSDCTKPWATDLARNSNNKASGGIRQTLWVQPCSLLRTMGTVRTRSGFLQG
jgi:hypothetical protein